MVALSAGLHHPHVYEYNAGNKQRQKKQHHWDKARFIL